MSRVNWIVCAANRHCETGVIICGARHFDSVMNAAMKASGGFPHWLNCDQGFIDNKGVFLTRQEAHAIALKNDQIRYRCGGDEADGGTLYSDNLY